MGTRSYVIVFAILVNHLYACTAAPQINLATTTTPETTISQTTGKTPSVTPIATMTNTLIVWPTIIHTCQERELLCGKTGDYIRVIPAYLNPSTEFDEIIQQYESAIWDDRQHLTWFIGAPDGDGRIAIYVGTEADQTYDTITLQFPLEMIIGTSELSAQQINFVAAIPGPSGPGPSVFPVTIIRDGLYYVYPEEISYTELKSDGETGIWYDLPFKCLQPGIYHIQIHQSYSVRFHEEVTLHLFSYDVLFGCPFSSTLYGYDDYTQKILDIRSWIWDGRTWNLQPNN